MFTKVGKGKLLIVSMYVDDLIFTRNDRRLCEEFKNSMMMEFEMSDLGKMKHFLGIEVKQSSDGIFIRQRRYVELVVARFGMENSNIVKCPIVPSSKLSKVAGGERVDEIVFKQMVGSLMYLIAIRPDLMYSVCLISRFMSAPNKMHWFAVKRTLRYLKGTSELAILYKRGVKDNRIMGFTYSDYAGDLDNRRSTSRYVFMLGNRDASWASKKQPIVALSTREAKYIAIAAYACQRVWIKRVLKKLGVEDEERVVIMCNKISTIQLSRNLVFHGKSKHIDVRFHFLRDLVNNINIELMYCSTQYQIVDVMTKPLKLEQFERFQSMLGVTEMHEVS